MIQGIIQLYGKCERQFVRGAFQKKQVIRPYVPAKYGTR